LAPRIKARGRTEVGLSPDLLGIRWGQSNTFESTTVSEL
jgi:hypothetical protein